MAGGRDTFVNAARRVLLVTGGSRGIGGATSRLAAKRGYDVCVNFRSDAKAADLVNNAGIAASKGALDTFTVGLAQEVATEGIRVNAVRAGYIYTDMHALGGEPNCVDRVKEHVPMRRGGQPEEVAHAVLWLLSDEASFVTGSIVDVTGGKQGQCHSSRRLIPDVGRY